MLPIETERARGCPVDAASLISPCAKSSKNSKANRIETGERSGGIGEICSLEVEEK
jgi:hypothetical protein